MCGCFFFYLIVKEIDKIDRGTLNNRYNIANNPNVSRRRCCSCSCRRPISKPNTIIKKFN